MILDIHTHRMPPQPQAVVSVRVDATGAAFTPLKDQLYSAGIHPWDTTMSFPDATVLKELEALCADPQIVAVGECGIDKLKGAPLFRQMLVMRRLIEISEKVGKPLIIHSVRAHDTILGLKKDLVPRQKWLIHGFRGKPSVAKMLTDAGIFLSFGTLHNDDTVRTVPLELMLAETDDNPESIETVIASLSALRGRDLTGEIAANTMRFLGQ